MILLHLQWLLLVPDTIPLSGFCSQKVAALQQQALQWNHG